MPPKGAKKGSAKKSSTDGGAVNKNWETGLIKAEFEKVCRLTDHFFFWLSLNSLLETFILFSHWVNLAVFS